MTTKHDLVITALQQRIVEIVTHYETQMAILRADITMLAEEKQTEED